MNDTIKANYLNIGFIVLSLGLAFILPIQLFLFSYVVLGPLHYLTEISWLKDKGFFVKEKKEKLLLFSALIVLLLASSLFEQIGWLSQLRENYLFILYIGFLICISLVIFKTDINRIVFVIAGVLGTLVIGNGTFFILMAMYLTTIIHVYIFTGMFLLYGSLKSPHYSSYIMITLFILAPFVCFIVPLNWTNPATENFIHFYQHTFSDLNLITLKAFFDLENVNVYTNEISIMLTRFFAFAYTYHYLNWFSKTKTIKWNNISKKRGLIIALIWGACLGLYLIDPILGYSSLFILSFSHVILEFPLNGITGLFIYNHLNPFKSKKDNKI